MYNVFKTVLTNKMLNTHFFIGLIEHFKYVGIFVGAFLEGPITGMITGFLIKLGYLSFVLGYLSHVIGDLAADCVYYYIGYQGQKRLLGKFKISEKSLEKAQQIKKIFYKHPCKVIIGGKLTHLFGLPVLVSIGLAKYPWFKFLFFDFVATLIKSAILISIGFYFNHLWQKTNSIVDYLGLIGIFLFIIVAIYLLIRLFMKRGAL